MSGLNAGAKVRGVKGEDEGEGTVPRRDPVSLTTLTVRHTVLQAHILWSASHLANYPGHQGGIHLHHCRFTTSRAGLKALEKFKKHDSHSVRQLVQVGVDMAEQVEQGGHCPDTLGSFMSTV